MSRTPLIAAAIVLAGPAPAAFAQATPTPPATPATPAAPATPTAPPQTPAAGGEPVKLTKAETKRLQRKLRVTADGAWGPKSRAALRRAERRLGLDVDGRPDAIVLEKLGVKFTAVPVAPASTTQPTSAPAPGGEAAAAVQAAMGQVGTPYEAAGDKPGGFDCSGLTSWAYGQAGVELPHSSFQQYKLGTAVPKDQIQPGDLVFFSTAGDGPSDVGIATSPTKVVSATTKGVKEHETFDEYWGSNYVGARRLSPAPSPV